MRLHPSEVGWQSFLMATRKEIVSPRKLRAIIQYFIVNKPTKSVIFEVLRNSTVTRSGPNGYREYSELDNGFFALLGSLLGTSTMRMLLDHKAQIGYKTIEKVVLLEDSESLPEDGLLKSRTMMLILSDERRKPMSPTRLPQPDPRCHLFAAHRYPSRRCSFGQLGKGRNVVNERIMNLSVALIRDKTSLSPSRLPIRMSH